MANSMDYKNSFLDEYDKISKGDKEGLDKIYRDIIEDIAKNPPKPRQKSKPENLREIVVHPVANGFAITCPEMSKKLFVFNTIDEACEWIKDHIAPTDEGEEFLENV